MLINFTFKLLFLANSIEETKSIELSISISSIRLVGSKLTILSKLFLLISKFFCAANKLASAIAKADSEFCNSYNVDEPELNLILISSNALDTDS